MSPGQRADTKQECFACSSCTKHSVSCACPERAVLQGQLLTGTLICHGERSWIWASACPSAANSYGWSLRSILKSTLIKFTIECHLYQILVTEFWALPLTQMRSRFHSYMLMFSPVTRLFWNVVSSSKKGSSSNVIPNHKNKNILPLSFLYFPSSILPQWISWRKDKATFSHWNGKHAGNINKESLPNTTSSKDEVLHT